MITIDTAAAYHRTKWALLVRGLLSIAIGAFILFRPLDSVAAFALVVAIWALVDGIVNVVHALDIRSIMSHWWVLLLEGAVGIMFGVAALYFYPVLSLAFAVAWSAWWLIAAGMLGIYAATQQRRSDVPWASTITFGVLALACGFLAIAFPSITLAMLMGMLAGFGIIGGMVMLFGFVKMQSFEHQVERELRTAPGV